MKKGMIALCAVVLSIFLMAGESEAAKKPSVTLKKNTTQVTGGNVAVSVTVKKGGKIKSIKCRSGKIKKTGKKYWKNAVTITKSKIFYADDNGWYTVRVQNKKGRVTCKSVCITNIDNVAPAVDGDYSVANRVGTVRLVTADYMSGIDYVGYAKGYITETDESLFTAAQAASGGSVRVSEDFLPATHQFTVVTPGYYTAYVRDGVGNVTLYYVQVTLWTELRDMNVFDSRGAGHRSGTEEDRWGNVYSNPIGLYVYDDSSAYLEYYLGGEYNELTGTIVRSKKIWDEAVVWLEFYVDDELVFTSEKMDYKTQPEEFAISLNRAKYLKIKCCCTGVYSWQNRDCDILITDARLYK